MKDTRRTEYDKQPEHIMNLGDGTYYYNYDIQEKEMSRMDGDAPEQFTGYDAVVALVQGTPEYKKTVKALIRKYYTSDEEFDLINSYNEALQKGLTEGKDIDAYKEYLALRNAIKAYVKGDFDIKGQQP